MIRAATYIVLAAVLGGGPAFAETTQCRSIQSRKDREACYERQKTAKQAPTKLGSTKMGDTVDQMKVDDDLLTKRLQGICRGC
jgi:hypothetical protein